MPHVALLGPRPPHAKRARVAVVTLAVILAAIYFVAGATKLMALDFHIESFDVWGYPIWAMYLVGIVEVLLAAFLLVPATRFWGGALLAIEMLGAIVTHLRVEQYAFAVVPFLLMLAAAAIAWAERPYAMRQQGRAPTRA